MHVFCLVWHLEFAELAECNFNFKRLLSLTFSYYAGQMENQIIRISKLHGSFLLVSTDSRPCCGIPAPLSFPLPAVKLPWPDLNNHLASLSQIINNWLSLLRILWYKNFKCKNKTKPLISLDFPGYLIYFVSVFRSWKVTLSKWSWIS